LAQAEERLGHLVVAQETYLKVIREQLPSGAPPAFVSAQKDAKDRLATLSPRIPQITVFVTKSSDDQPVNVTMDGKPVPEALVGVARPVDPGTHEFLATSADAKSEVVRIEVKQGATETVTLTLGVSAPKSTPPTTPVTSFTEEPPSSGPGAWRIGSYAVMGVGVVGLGVGTVYAIVGSNKRSEADDRCAPDASGRCTGDEGKINSLDHDADQAGTISTIGFVGGGVCLAAGITMFLLAPSKSQPPKSAWVRPYVGPQNLGLIGGF
jgi:hypothetical protein